jgi:hypothetical protein
MSDAPCTLSLRARPKGGPVLAKPLDPLDADRIRNARELTFLVHGFNVNQQEGIESTRLFADLLQLPPGNVPVSVLWPGDHWVRALSYPLEGRDADLAGDELARFVSLHVPSATRLNFVAHSLGARVVMRAVERLDQHRPVARVCLLAAAIDADSVSRLPTYRAATTWVQRLAVLSSGSDDVLRVAYPVGDLLQAIGFRADTPGFALGFRGPQPHRQLAVPENVHDEPISGDRHADHGHYFPKKTKKPVERVQRNQRSAARYVRAVLSGDPDPRYE